ncbi:MAG: ABC transporter permease [Clostridiales bacterium]|nr:ABC transporter permease [Clostridiales bacterium]
MQRIYRKIIALISTLFIISIVTFAVFHVIPGDPAMQILGTEASPERLELLRKQLGIDKSLPKQYITWVQGIAKGDFGESIKYRKPVRDIIVDRIPVTVALSSMAIILIFIISIPISVYSCKKEHTLLDECINVLTVFSVSVPGFFMGILFVWVFGLLLRAFIPGAYISYQENFMEFLKYLFFPALVIAIPNSAVVIKYLRSSIQNEMKLDYVRTAFSKGYSENAVLFRHVLKNALVPLISLLGMIVGDVFSGSIIIEQVFNVPGIGKLLIAAITARDYPLIQTLVVIIACIVVFSNTLADIILQIIDPRIRIE